jgi:uncharacterized protein (DUF58 family)
MLTGFLLYILEGVAYKRLWDKGLSSDVKITPSRAFRGDNCKLEITLANRKLIPLPWLWVKLHISSALLFNDSEKPKGDYVYRNALFCIMGWQEINRTLTFTCTKRGYYPLRSFEVIGTSILFNGKQSHSFDTSCAVTVYPALVDNKDISQLLARLDGEVAAQGFTNPDPFEFAGIRQYTPSDSFRDINFRASAHSGTLMTNTHNPTIKGELTIILCIKSLKGSFEDERFEYSISLAATLAEHFISNGFTVALKCNAHNGETDEVIFTDAGIGSGQLNTIYEALAALNTEKYDTVDILTTLEESIGTAVFISPTVDMDILKLYDDISGHYTQARWLYPVMSFDAPRTQPPVDTAEIVCVPPEKH